MSLFKLASGRDWSQPLSHFLSPDTVSRFEEQMAKARPKLKAKDIKAAVKKVLKGVVVASNNERAFLTAYQILDRLPDAKRKLIVREREGAGGKGTGKTYAAASLVSKALQGIDGIEIAYLDCAGIELTFCGQRREPAGKTMGLYRLKKSSTAAPRRKAVKKRPH